MEPKPKFHGPAFTGLETSERLSDAQVDLVYLIPQQVGRLNQLNICLSPANTH